MVDSLLTLWGKIKIVESETKKPKACLRKKKVSLRHMIQLWQGDEDDGEAWLQSHDDFRKKDWHCKDVCSENLVASVRKESKNLRNIALDKDSYIVRVEPGYDVALIVFLVIAIDEHYRED